MHRLLLCTLFLSFGALLSAQNDGFVRFEVNVTCGEVENSPPLANITGVNFRAATAVFNGDPNNNGTTAAAESPGGVSLVDRTTFASFPMTDAGDGTYFIEFQGNGTAANYEIRWFYEIEYDDPDNAGTTLTANENLVDEANANLNADIPFYACDVQFGNAGPTRKFFVNGPQRRHVRNALGRCVPCNGSEWRVNMDYASVPEGVTVNNALLTMGGNRFLSWDNGFVFVPLINTGGSVYSMRFPVRAAGDFFVGNFNYNFSTAEQAFLAEGTGLYDVAPDRICEVYPWGGRANFTPAGGQVKVVDYLWGSWETTTPGTAVKQFTANTTVTANMAYTAADGFTYYMENSNQLIAIDWDGQTPAAAADVSVTFGAEMATFYADGTGFVSTGNEANGAAILGRTWNVENTTISAPVTVRYFYSEAEFDAMNALIANQDGGAAIGHDEMNFFKVVNENADETDIPSLTPNDIVLIEPGGVSEETFTPGDLTSGCNAVIVRRYADFQVASFSGGGGGGAELGSALLPVELVSFTGRPVGKTVSLDWVTASETGNAYFVVEHSTDGRRFTDLNRVNGRGTVSTTTAYNFPHATPYTGANYYRLRQTDLDGTIAYSEVVRVDLEDDLLAGQVYPNPATDELTVITPNAGQLSLLDTRGRTLTTTAATAATTTVPVRDLTPGVYFIRFDDGRETTTVRFVKR